MIGRTNALLGSRTAGLLRVRLPHILSTGGPLRSEAAQNDSRAREGAYQMSSFAAVDALRVPPVPPFPPMTKPSDVPSFAYQEGSRESSALQAIRRLVAEGEIGAFNLYDINIVRDQLNRFRRNLPRVQPFYAVKCNPNEKVVSLLASEGCNFDCASKAEIEIVCRNGGSPDRIIFANPCKQPSHVAFAAATGVEISTFDGADELFKIAALQPNARLIVRVMVDDSHAVCTMSQKYGAPLSQLPELLSVAKSLDLDVIGVSYHVGSGSKSAQPFADAVRTARGAFDLAAQHGFTFSLLDIGGGFPGALQAEAPDNAPLLAFPQSLDAHKPPTFEEIAAVLRPALDEHFPVGSGVQIIAEPGRYMVMSSSTLMTNIIGRKFANKGLPNERPMYFVNDGLYGSFNCVLYDHKQPRPLPLFASPQAASREQDTAHYSECSVWGSTCDGMDCVAKDARLPLLSVGDWIRWPNMGAYTSAAGSNFNGMDRPVNYYL